MRRVALTFFALATLAFAGPADAASPGLRGMQCRGGAEAQIERPDASSMRWRLSAPVGAPASEELAPYQCRWEDVRTGDESYVALSSCCIPGDTAMLVERIRSGRPFAIYGHSAMGPNARPGHFDVRYLRD